MKYIFTIATNVYAEYFENFKNSINNFYPNDDKTLVVFTNELSEYNNYQIGKTLIKIISIPNLLYTSILLNKFNFIEWYCNDNNIKDNQIIYFFDIDTLFYDDNQIALNHLDNLLENNKDKVIFSSHPNNLINKHLGTTIFTHGFLKEFSDNGAQPKIFNDYSFTTPQYLLNYNIITSFFTGTLFAIKQLNIKFIEIYKNIMHTDRVICNIQEEDICNYILLKELRNEYDIEYIYKNTNEIYFINFNEETINNKTYFYKFDYDFDMYEEYYKYFICNQKYDTSRKQITK